MLLFSVPYFNFKNSRSGNTITSLSSAINEKMPIFPTQQKRCATAYWSCLCMADWYFEIFGDFSVYRFQSKSSNSPGFFLYPFWGEKKWGDELELTLKGTRGINVVYLQSTVKHDGETPANATQHKLPFRAAGHVSLGRVRPLQPHALNASTPLHVSACELRYPGKKTAGKGLQSL